MSPEEILRAAFATIDPFNSPFDDAERETTRSNPPSWRTIDGGLAGQRGPLTDDEIRRRRNEIGLARYYYRAEGVAARMERELVEDIRRYGRFRATRAGFPIVPIDGGSAA